MAKRSDEDGEQFDPTARELCPDGNCIGVIGADGRCRVCGKRGESNGPYRDAAAVLPVGEEATEGDEEGDEGDREGEEEGDEEEEGDWEGDEEEDEGKAGEERIQVRELELDDRRLCPDGSCIGLIGADGRCKECGRAAE